MPEQNDDCVTPRKQQIRAIKLCLDELGVQAEANDLALAANLIGAAARALEDEIYENEIRNRARDALLERTYNA